MLSIKLKRIKNAATWWQLFCLQNPPPPPPPQTLGRGSTGQNSAFSEYGHVAYQIKDNQECSNMVANILPAD